MDHLDALIIERDAFLEAAASLMAASEKCAAHSGVYYTLRSAADENRKLAERTIRNIDDRYGEDGV